MPVTIATSSGRAGGSAHSGRDTDNRWVNGLKDKVAIVTGAGWRGPGLGNGRAAATLFARESARVLCVDHVKERAEEAVASIRAEGGAVSWSGTCACRRPRCR
jgi:NAD(P)-dependent dehydrogenase (short-subunit alcohol dehydrogenase family)